MFISLNFDTWPLFPELSMHLSKFLFVTTDRLCNNRENLKPSTVLFLKQENACVKHKFFTVSRRLVEGHLPIVGCTVLEEWDSVLERNAGGS